MKIIVVGQFCWYGYGSVETELRQEPGGIIYPLYALSSVAKKGDIIYPVFPIEKEILSELQSENNQLLYLDWSYLFESNGKLSKWLVSENSDQEVEFKTISLLSDKITEEKIPSVNADLVYVNFQSGNDIKTDDLKFLKLKNPNAHIHIDINRFAKQLIVSNKNNHDVVKQELGKLFSVSDTVQMGNHELLGLVYGTGLTEKELVKMALVDYNTKAILIPKGKRGVVCYERDINTIQTHIFKTIYNTTDMKAIGDSDILGSVFAYDLVKNQGIRSAIIKGIRLAEIAAAKLGFQAKAEHIRLNGPQLS